MNAEKSQALELRIQGSRRRPSQKRFDEQLQTLETNGGRISPNEYVMKQNQMEIIELEKKITKVNNSLHGFSNRQRP